MGKHSSDQTQDRGGYNARHGALESFEVSGAISDRIRGEAELRQLAERESYGDRVTEGNDQFINP